MRCLDPEAAARDARRASTPRRPRVTRSAASSRSSSSASRRASVRTSRATSGWSSRLAAAVHERPGDAGRRDRPRVRRRAPAGLTGARPDRLGRGTRAIARSSNKAGGVEGGISTGAPIVLRAAMKPISTLRGPLGTVELGHARRASSRATSAPTCAPCRPPASSSRPSSPWRSPTPCWTGSAARPSATSLARVEAFRARFARAVSGHVATVTTPAERRTAVVLVGFMGCGKSTSGSLVARTPRTCRSSTATLSSRQRQGAIAAIFASEGEDGFRELERETWCSDLLRGTGRASRGALPRGRRGDGCRRARGAARRAHVVWLTAPPDVLWARVRAHEAGPTPRRPLARTRPPSGGCSRSARRCTVRSRTSTVDARPARSPTSWTTLLAEPRHERG